MEEGKISHEEKLFKADFYRHLDWVSGGKEVKVGSLYARQGQPPGKSGIS